jgi:hypothetical protein
LGQTDVASGAGFLSAMLFRERYFCTLKTETEQVINLRAGYNYIEKCMNGTTRRKIRVLRLRLKDKHAKFLSDLAREVNFVWNYCNELQITIFNRERRLLSGHDFARFTRGATKEGLPLHSQTVQAIAEEYATRRRQFKKVRLSWRKSTGSRRKPRLDSVQKDCHSCRSWPGQNRRSMAVPVGQLWSRGVPDSCG